MTPIDEDNDHNNNNNAVAPLPPPPPLPLVPVVYMEPVPPVMATMNEDTLLVLHSCGAIIVAIAMIATMIINL
jgi:hypothetical protein